MSDRIGRSVRRLILQDIIGSLLIAWTLTMVLTAVSLGVGVPGPVDWSMIALCGVVVLCMAAGCTWIVCRLPRQRAALRSCERAAAGRLIQRMALAQVHAGVVPISQLGWLVLTADALTFTPDPELPSMLPWKVTLPEPGQEVDVPPIARAAILGISSERAGYGRVLRVRWADPSGRPASTDFFIKGRHGRWVAASPDRPARPPRTWIGRRAGSLPPAIARIRPAASEPAGSSGRSPVRGQPAEPDERRPVTGR